MRINKYLPIAFIYFFFNSLGLPHGLTYTALLSPLLYLWILSVRKKDVLLPFLLVLLPFIIIHLLQGVDLKAYFISLLNLISVYIFCQAFFSFIKLCTSIESIFQKILIVNFVLCIISIPFYFTSLYEVFWIKQVLTEGIDEFLRLKMFTYEASYYSTLFTPIFFYYLLEIIFKRNQINTVFLFLMLFLPLLLSFSMGVISCMLLSMLLVYLFYFQTFARKKNVFYFLVFSTFFFIIGIIGMGIFFPENPLFIRIANVITGNDISGKARTSDAFYLTSLILDHKSHLWGIGLGQLKLLGADIIRAFYNYPVDFDIITIPNAAAETLLIFGWLGFILRIVILLFMFFHTKVWRNYYRLLLFIYIFIYQFTGSFITNIAEYVIWILAFTNVFPYFNVLSSRTNRKNLASHQMN